MHDTVLPTGQEAPPPGQVPFGFDIEYPGFRARAVPVELSHRAGLHADPCGHNVQLPAPSHLPSWPQGGAPVVVEIEVAAQLTPRGFSGSLNEKEPP